MTKRFMPEHFLSNKKEAKNSYLNISEFWTERCSRFIFNFFFLPSRNFQHLRRVEETYFKCCMTNLQDGLTHFRLMLA